MRISLGNLAMPGADEFTQAQTSQFSPLLHCNREPLLSDRSLTRRQAIVGASAIFLTGCNGEGSPASAPGAKSPTPTPTSIAPSAEVFGPEVVAVRQFYKPEDGNNLQPAFQAAIDAASASGKPKVVSDFGAISAEMWCPVRTSPFTPKWGVPGAFEPDGRPLVVRRAIHLDFRGAKFDLKGPHGGPRQQPVSGYDKPWLGGWLYVVGHPGFGRLTIENVTVDGGFDGSYQTNDASNLSDKGIWIDYKDVHEIYMHDVELRNFAGEIYYCVGSAPEYQYIENCHFHGSPQCAWNPANVGKVKAVNLRAGRAYMCAEVVGGKGHVYEGGLFYDSGSGGSVFYGGPSPNFVHGTYPWWYPYWDGVGEKPWLDFRGTRFEALQCVRLSSWARGDIETRDTPVWLDPWIGDVRDIDLRIKAWTDRVPNSLAVMFGGPPDLTTQVPEAKPGIFVKPPSNINIQLECLRSNAAVGADYKARWGVLFLGGLLDIPSIFINVSGQARQPWGLESKAPASSVLPQVTTTGFVTV